jgi:hypothetical protein
LQEFKYVDNTRGRRVQRRLPLRTSRVQRQRSASRSSFCQPRCHRSFCSSMEPDGAYSIVEG